MSMITNSYKLDIRPGGVPLVIFVSQYDTKARVMEFTLIGDGGTIAYGSSVSAAVRGTKPDGNVFDYAATSASISGSSATVTITITEQMTAVAGRVPCEIYLYKGTPPTSTTEASSDYEQLATANFILQVERAAADLDTIRSDSDVRQLYEVDRDFDEIIDAAEAIQTALATAVRYDEAQTLTDTQKGTARTNIAAASAADVTALGTRMTAAESDIDALDIDERLLLSMIKGTTQTPVFVNGVISSVVHKDGSNNTIRTDTFNLSGNPMVETRTLNTGDVLTISTNLTTLASTITYTPAS